MVEDGEPLDALVRGQRRVHVLEHLCEYSVHLGQLRQRRVIARTPLPAGPCAEVLLVEGDHRREELPLVAVHDHLADQRRLRLHLVLEVLRRDVLAARGDDDVLL
ncbi:MAG: hypothetical protein ACK559_12875, partial [bacterium]